MHRLHTSGIIALIGLVFVALVSLGIWQLSRNDYKHTLQQERTAAIAASPLLISEAVGRHIEELEYHRLVLEGEWDYGHIQIITNRTRYGLRGEELYVPLIPKGGGPAILVNRGWYPSPERTYVLNTLESNTPDNGLILGQLKSGRTSTANGIWIRFDLNSIAAELPYDVAPFRVLAGELRSVPYQRLPNKLPVTGYQGYRSTTPHMQYALTWFGLAITLVITVSTRFWQHRRDRKF